MAKKIIWTPKVLDPHNKKDPLRWCKIGQHLFKAYTVNPRKKICIYCDKVEDNNYFYDLQTN